MVAIPPTHQFCLSTTVEFGLENDPVVLENFPNKEIDGRHESPFDDIGLLDYPECDIEMESAKFLHSPCNTEETISDSDETVLSEESEPKPKKSVNFSHLEIRKHSVVVGDHPFSKRLPISLSWEHAEETDIVDIETFERSRVGERRHRRQLRMSYYERKHVLKKVAGMTESQIVRAERRRASRANLETNLVNEEEAFFSIPISDFFPLKA